MVDPGDVSRTSAVALLLLAPAAVAAEPVQELFLGETSELNEAGEVQLTGSLSTSSGRLTSPLELEVGVVDHVEVAAEMPMEWSESERFAGAAEIHVGVGTPALSAYVGAQCGWLRDRMESRWGAVAALGLVRGRLSLYASGELERDGASGAVSAVFALGALSPLVEVSYDRERAAVAAGAVWKFHDHMELGGAAALDNRGEPKLMMNLVAELDLIGGSDRK